MTLENRNFETKASTRDIDYHVELSVTISINCCRMVFVKTSQNTPSMLSSFEDGGFRTGHAGVAMVLVERREYVFSHLRPK